MTRSRVVAHRGASGLVPHGNTPAAFDAAVGVDARWAEIDVRRTADGALVVHHDAHVGDRALGRLTLDEARRATDDAGYALCTLDEVLERWADRLCLDVELKEPGSEAMVIRTVRRYLSPERCVYTSFVDASVRTLRRLAPDTGVGLLLGTGEPTPLVRTRMSELFPIRRARACGATFVGPNEQLVRLRFVQRMRLAGLGVWVWTVNDPLVMQRLFRLGVEAVITDRPDIALGVRAGLLGPHPEPVAVGTP